MKRLDGKVAIVTGGGDGIGRASCLRLAQEGAAVVVAEIDESSGTAVADEVGASGGFSQFVQTDVGSEESVRVMVAQVNREFGKVDVLVNNAATFVLKGVDATVDDWRNILDVNVIGPALVTKHVVPHMRRAGKGAIVNLGSISSFIAQSEMLTYNATKGAIASMTRCMALDLAADGIRVNAVCPGTVWTKIVQQLTGEAGLDRAAADRHPDWGGAHMLNRLADPSEIANAILFLASDEASFVTAECLMVDGGYIAK